MKLDFSATVVAAFAAALSITALGTGALAQQNHGESADGLKPYRKRAGVPVYRMDVLSPRYTIDKIYKSMEGPTSMTRRRLTDEPTGEPELFWIIGYRSRVTGTDGDQSQSPEFMCHTAMDTDARIYARTFGSRLTIRGNRLFSVDQGTSEIELPDGFGIPVMSNQSFLVATQVLNHNFNGPAFDVRQRVTVDFVRHADLDEPLRPLVQHGVYAMVLLSGPDGHAGLAPGVATTAEHGPGCSMAPDRGDPRGHVRDGHGRRFSSFWVVKPGRHQYHTRVTDFLALPYDTTLHFAAAHLHPFAESLELVDLTTGTRVCKLRATQAERGVGLASVEHFSSIDGAKIFKGHEYDLVAVYNNDSGVDQDAMATLLLYLEARDVEFIAAKDSTDGRLWRNVTPGS